MDDHQTNTSADIRHRRTSSVTRATDITISEKKIRKKQPDQPVHCPKDSLLSSSSGYTNYRGLLNLCFIILVLSNVRVALENVIKYGILVDPIQWVLLVYNMPNTRPIFLLLFGSALFPLMSFILERFLLVKRLISNTSGAICSTVIIFSLLSLPPLILHSGKCNPVGASICCLVYSIVSLKLASYHMVNYWCRIDRSRCHRRHNSCDLNRSHPILNGGRMENGSNVPMNHSETESTGNGIHPTPLVTYPNNLTIFDLVYFMYAPTLCYELNFPRADRIRKRFLTKRILELIFLVQLDLGLIQQWMVPTIQNSLEPFREMSFSIMLERLLKLAVPNHLIWIIFFYLFFHSFMNVLAELLRFSDREFYRDWWNSESVNYFWQNWNIPVHRWCVRHVYIPLLSQDRIHFNRFTASTAVFLLSAFFHEYLVSVPLNMFRLWAFTGMIMQLPLSFFVAKYLNSQTANIAVWISLILGQPLCILMYYHDYYVIHIVQNG